MAIDLKEALAGADENPARVFSRMLKLSRGLFTLRYLAAEDDRQPPCIGIQTGPYRGQDVTIIGGPDAERGFLCKPGDAAVVVSQGDAIIVVTTFVGEHARSDGVKLKLDQIDRLTPRDGELLRTAVPGRGGVAGQDRGLPIFLSGYIAGIGAVSLKAGKRLGEARSGHAIEGFAIHWPRRPVGVDLAYGCTALAGSTATETLTGDLAGSRGEGGAISGLFIRLIGEKAGRYSLNAEALFADGSRVVSSSQALAARAGDGAAPLVALSVAVHRPRQLAGTLSTPGQEVSLEHQASLENATSLEHEVSPGQSAATNAIMDTSQSGDLRARRAVGIRPGRIRLFRGMQRLPTPEAAE